MKKNILTHFLRLDFGKIVQNSFYKDLNYKCVGPWIVFSVSSKVQLPAKHGSNILQS